MLKRVGTWVVVLVALAWTTSALAERPRRSRRASVVKKASKPLRARAAQTATTYQKVQRMSFLDDVVDAGVQRPDGVVVSGTTRAPQTSLIRVRMNFVPELIKSAEDI